MDSSSNLRARAFLPLKMLENGAKRRRMQTILRATLLLFTEYQQDEIVCSQSHLHGPSYRYHYGWPPAQLCHG